MKLTYKVASAAGFLLFVTAGVAFWWALGWLRADAVALDYSALDASRGPEDPQINGYSMIREFSTGFERDDTEELDAIWLAEFEEWDGALIAAYLENYRELLDVFRNAFTREQFYFDQANTPETLIPEVGALRHYVQLRLLEIRLARVEGRTEHAYEKLFQLKAELDRYQQSGGALIALLVGVASKGLMMDEAFDLLGDQSLPDADPLHYTSSLADHTSVEHMKQAFRHEFQFFVNCLKQLLEDPYEFLLLVNDDMQRENKARQRAILKWAAPYLVKPNRTINAAFLGYSEVVDQAHLPAIGRDLQHSRHLSVELEDSNWRDLISGNPIGKILMAILFPAVEKVVEAVDRSRAHQAALQLSVALRFYYEDFGQLPDALPQLIPEYIETIPLDPFDGMPMRYSPERAIVYSVGIDYEDSGGSDLPFRHTVDEEVFDDFAERDKDEPTFPLRFVQAGNSN